MGREGFASKQSASGWMGSSRPNAREHCQVCRAEASYQCPVLNQLSSGVDAPTPTAGSFGSVSWVSGGFSQRQARRVTVCLSPGSASSSAHTDTTAGLGKGPAEVYPRLYPFNWVSHHLAKDLGEP